MHPFWVTHTHTTEYTLVFLICLRRSYIREHEPALCRIPGWLGNSVGSVDTEALKASQVALATARAKLLRAIEVHRDFVRSRALALVAALVALLCWLCCWRQ